MRDTEIARERERERREKRKRDRDRDRDGVHAQCVARGAWYVLCLML